jgi:hypothetical protein
VFQEAAARLERPHGAFERPLRRRLARDVEKRRALFAAQLLEFRTETLGLLAPSDVLPDVAQLVLEHPPGTLAVEDPQPVALPLGSALALSLASAAARLPTTYAATAAWAATADELVTRGISNRPSLIIAEITALALTPLAIYELPERGEST